MLQLVAEGLDDLLDWSARLAYGLALELRGVVVGRSDSGSTPTSRPTPALILIPTPSLPTPTPATYYPYPYGLALGLRGMS